MRCFDGDAALAGSRGADTRRRSTAASGSLHWTQGDPALHPLLASWRRNLGVNSTASICTARPASAASPSKTPHHEFPGRVGVGNIYASEALFRARVRRAARPAASPVKRRQNLGAGHQGRARRGDQDRRHKLARLRQCRRRSRYFRQKLFVYERAGEACRVCRSAVKHFAQGQRSTYWCSTCQR